jgi:hypothetical protein
VRDDRGGLNYRVQPLQIDDVSSSF